MQERFMQVGHILLLPAHWVAGLIGLPDHLPVIQLSVGLALLSFCLGLALLAWLTVLRGNRALSLLAVLVSIATGVIGLLASVVFAHAWLYALILTILTGDVFWRLASKKELPRPIRLGLTTWMTACLLITVGGPTLFTLHTAFVEKRASTALDAALRSEVNRLTDTDLKRVTEALGTLAARPELVNADTTNGAGLVLILQQLALESSIPSLTLVGNSRTVLARTLPATVMGDAWPLDTSHLKGEGLVLSERSTPLIMSAVAVAPANGANLTLIGAVPLDQPYITARAKDSRFSLFLAGSQGITALSSTDGLALNPLSSASVDSFVSKATNNLTAFSVTGDGMRFLARTVQVNDRDGQALVLFGGAYRDTSANARFTLDMIVVSVIALAGCGLFLLLQYKKKRAL